MLILTDSNKELQILKWIFLIRSLAGNQDEYQSGVSFFFYLTSVSLKQAGFSLVGD